MLGRLPAAGIDRGAYAAEAKGETIARITPVKDLATFTECALVTEAVFEASRLGLIR